MCWSLYLWLNLNFNVKHFLAKNCFKSLKMHFYDGTQLYKISYKVKTALVDSIKVVLLLCSRKKEEIGLYTESGCFRLVV